MNKRKVHNPFILTGYVSAEYFCDRQKETEKLGSALYNGRNITLISPRRMGKTGLIHHLFEQVEQEGIAKCFYVDLYQTDSLASLVKKLADTVLGHLDTTQERIVKNVVSFFRNLRPMISIDAMTGEPGFCVNVAPERAEYSLKEVFEYMEKSEIRCYVAFDEFQVVANYEDKNVEALLRSYIQKLTNVNFIFSGSRRGILENMFASASRPFYQSTQIIPLGEISADAYYDFAKKKYEEHSQLLRKDVFDYIYSKLYGHTWYIHAILNRLYELKAETIEVADVERVLTDSILENEAMYQTIYGMITNMQAKVLHSVACENGVREVQSKNFIKKYNLGAASSVITSIKSLVDKELILNVNGEYQVYDRFFGIWLTTIS